MRFIGGTALVIAALALSGCAGTSGKATATATKTVTAAAPQPVSFDQSTVVKYLHLAGGDNDYFFTAPGGKRCEVNVILTSAPSVALYADAGDTVAANPAQTAGVKVIDDDDVTCKRLITKALADFPPAT